MATIKSKAERSRALGVALTGKAARQMERRPFPPGEHGRGGRRHDSCYKLRLR